MLATVQQIQYVTLVFIIPNKEGNVRFITNYRGTNQKLVRKPCPLPRIGETMHQLEGFQYATELDITMGYYTIRLSPASQDMTTIVTEFGKFKYNHLPIGMYASEDIFQANIDQLLDNIESFKTYIDDILVLRKNTFEKHIEQLIILSGRLRAAGL